MESNLIMTNLELKLEIMCLRNVEKELQEQIHPRGKNTCSITVFVDKSLLDFAT